MSSRITPPFVAASRPVGTGNRTLALGALLGAAIFAGPATPAPPSSTLLAQQEAAVARQIQQEAADCATGAKPGTIGHAIGSAVRIHTEIASATPRVESLFDLNNDCFSALRRIFDLSFTIPSLSQIMAAAQAAVIEYAQRQVCTAVNQVTTMVVVPINQAIGVVNQLADLNGQSNGMVASGMSQLDPALGSAYHGVTGGSYTVDVNPFKASQTSFSVGAGAAAPPSAVPAAAPAATPAPQPARSDRGDSWWSRITNPWR